MYNSINDQVNYVTYAFRKEVKAKHKNYTFMKWSEKRIIPTDVTTNEFTETLNGMG